MRWNAPARVMVKDAQSRGVVVQNSSSGSPDGAGKQQAIVLMTNRTFDAGHIVSGDVKMATELLKSENRHRDIVETGNDS